MYIRVFLFFLLFLVGCSPAPDEVDSQTKEGEVQINEYAEGFEITRFDDHVRIRVIDPATKEVDFEYCIGNNEVEGCESIPTNPSRVVALSATHIGMMQELNLIERLVGVSSADYICSTALQEMIQKKETLSLGDIGASDIEGYLAAEPDLIMTSGFDNKAPILSKMKSAGLTLFTNYDWKETHPLGRAEWIKVFGVLFHEEGKANELFEVICNKYIEISEKVASNESKPSVLVGTMYGDIFNAPAGDSYMAQLLTDAHVDYIYQNSKGVGSLTLTLEEVISTNRSTNFWLNPAAQNKMQLLQMNARFELLECVENGMVFSYYKNVNCFWEQSAIQPHLFLEDLCKIFYPELFNNTDLTFYSIVAP
jgi:iron complex transport system substrate-binding protein